MTRGGSNIALPVGVRGTPVIEREKSRMFVVAASANGAGGNDYTIFDLALDTDHISHHHKPVDPGASGCATFNPSLLDQHTAINLVHGWLWLGFADFLAYDLGRFYWAVAIRSRQAEPPALPPHGFAKLLQ